MIDTNLDSKFDGKSPENKTNMHDILRLLQWLIPALVTLYGVFDKVFGWGLIGDVETIASGVLTFIGIIAQNSSKRYFSTKSIVDKVVPDTEEL